MSTPTKTVYACDCGNTHTAYRTTHAPICQRCGNLTHLATAEEREHATPTPAAVAPHGRRGSK